MNNRLLSHLDFTSVDPAFVKVSVIRHVLVWAIVAIAGISSVMLFADEHFSAMDIALLIGAVVLLIGAIWDIWLTMRRAKALGYLELDDELLVRKGIMFQEVTMVPYGRMQQVNLASGPLLRKFGLASVELVTASANSDASIPGLPLAEAERLRDKLTRLGQTKLEGL
ncbi:PH domain-containing protein [Arcanobacterium pinnipediorum]|uniref:PH domain-containing protein n=1 Tax=Arcanobacterium pinnipediorum TaxID=1503041 RepID=A0ABY5AI65_9ACTO|nr:PH domain-containing protein [Arcanobacterium pinnipediorum]USR79618.1 PH domain-containing protein [Arcanobacterium pinnipediorum]